MDAAKLFDLISQHGFSAFVAAVFILRDQKFKEILIARLARIETKLGLSEPGEKP